MATQLFDVLVTRQVVMEMMNAINESRLVVCIHHRISQRGVLVVYLMANPASKEEFVPWNNQANE